METAPKIITFTGPSGSGKTTVARALVELNSGIKLIRSHTTRDARPSDLPGEYSYNHRAADFESHKSVYLWIITAHGNTYATAKDDVTNTLLNGHLSLMLLVPEAVATLRSFIPGQVVPFFILPPSEEVLHKRLTERGDTAEAIERRIADGKNWQEDFKKFDIPYIKIANEGTPRQTAVSIQNIIAATHICEACDNLTALRR